MINIDKIKYGLFVIRSKISINWQSRSKYLLANGYRTDRGPFQLADRDPALGSRSRREIARACRSMCSAVIIIIHALACEFGTTRRVKYTMVYACEQLDVFVLARVILKILHGHTCTRSHRICVCINRQRYQKKFYRIVPERNNACCIWKSPNCTTSWHPYRERDRQVVRLIFMIALRRARPGTNGNTRLYYAFN